MGIGASLFLLAVGAILEWGVTVRNPSGFNINTIGTILMIVGAIGLVASLLFWRSGPWSRRGAVVEEREVL